MKKIISGILAGIICMSSFIGLNSSAESNIQNYNIDASLEGLMTPEKNTEVYIEDNLLYVKGDHCFFSSKNIEIKSSGQFDYSVYNIEDLQSGFYFILVGHHSFEISANRSTWIKIPLSIEIIRLPDGGYLYCGNPIEELETYNSGGGGFFFSKGGVDTQSFPTYYNYAGTFFRGGENFNVRGGELEIRYFDGRAPYFIKIGDAYIKVTEYGELIPWVQPVKTGDIDLNEKVDARDASLILSYSADCGAGNFSGTLEDWLLTQD